jgi:hypothetical protein
MMTLTDFVPPLVRLIGLFGETEHKAAASALRSQVKSILPLYPYNDATVTAAGASPPGAVQRVCSPEMEKSPTLKVTSFR